jgi:hypothetical protein
MLLLGLRGYFRGDDDSIWWFLLLLLCILFTRFVSLDYDHISGLQFKAIYELKK